MPFKSTPPIFAPNPSEPLGFSACMVQLTGQQWSGLMVECGIGGDSRSVAKGADRVEGVHGGPAVLGCSSS